MENFYSDIRKHVVMSLRGQAAPKEEDIKKHIAAVIQMQKSLGRDVDVNEDALFRDILTQVSTWQADPSVLRDRKHHNWLPAKKAQIQWNFWKRYRQYLEEEKGWPDIVTNKLDKVTDSVLGDIGDPAQARKWDRRGMVVGEVQSGKTANYTGLICKATDAGYKLIIVLAGMTNDLRSQTQSRLDAEFLGVESEIGKAGNKIGVGTIEEYGPLIVQPLTYSAKDGDFRVNKGANLQLGGNPILLVVKKNTSVLNRILTWVQNQGKTHPETGRKVVDNIPLLLLDDEADNASVNTKKVDEDPTAINRAIRQILMSFQKSSYVGYTATPFANIFILPDEENDASQYGDDLFPRGFIYHISPPSNYIGPAQLFGLSEDLDGAGATTEGLPLIRTLDGKEKEEVKRIFPPAHKKTHPVDELPSSLIEALKSFIISCAARRCRGQKDVHNSMLIHVTRYNDVQRQVIEKVNEELGSMLRMIEYNTGAQAKNFMLELENLWEKKYVGTTEAVLKVHEDRQITPLKWSDVQNELYPAVSRIQVRGINGDMKGVLDYAENPNGLSVIAVGGDKLSRGLTLEGLSVSYYIRPAKNYDTLLQMGRWFGYRPGYADLCRLYTTDELVAWYEHIAVANEELRREFCFMEMSRLTPEEYGLKIRTHAKGLSITATNKIRHGRKMRVSFSEHLSQTAVFHKDKKLQDNNFEVTENWIKKLPTPEVVKTDKDAVRRVVWQKAGPEKIIEFLEQFEVHPLSRQAEPDLLAKYITKLNTYDELTDWTIALISNSLSTANKFNVAGYEIGMIGREDDTKDTPDIYALKKANIISPADQFIDLSKEEIERALEMTRETWAQRKRRSAEPPTIPSGPFIRNVRQPQKGLLLIYPLDFSNFTPLFTSKPIIGFAISFPKSAQGDAGAIEYQVNTKFWRDRYGEEEDSDDA
jgi:hypothetical protein